MYPLCKNVYRVSVAMLGVEYSSTLSILIILLSYFKLCTSVDTGEDLLGVVYW